MASDNKSEAQSNIYSSSVFSSSTFDQEMSSHISSYNPEEDLPSFLKPDMEWTDNEEKAAVKKFQAGGWLDELREWSTDDRYSALDGECFQANKPTYSLESLGKLAAIAAADEDEEANNRARFVLMVKNGKEVLVFGQEGDPTSTISSHLELAQRQKVLAAGTVYFNAAGEITGFDNKSGGYKPDFKSLNPVLRILKNQRKLANDVTLNKVGDVGEELHSVTVKRNDLRQLYSSLSTELKMVAPSPKTVSTSSPRRIMAPQQRQSYSSSSSAMTETPVASTEIMGPPGLTSRARSLSPAQSPQSQDSFFGSKQHSPLKRPLEVSNTPTPKTPCTPRKGHSRKGPSEISL